MPDRKRLVLVVDDEEGIRELLREGLETRGFKIAMAADGVEAFEKSVELKPDLILLDVMMPRMDGWATLKKLRDEEKTKRIPVIMLTAKGETDALLRAERERVVDYFIKPINMEELLAFVRRYVY
jgi:DNA-binding response OmpR family regulator